jgi:type IV fimbrial biogenesis protein FimT
VRHLTRRGRRRGGQRGLTIVELMVGLAIFAFLAVSAAPFFTDFTTNSRLRENGNLLYAEALAAQSEAVKRNAAVRLSTNGATVQVIDRADPANPVVLRERLLAGGVTASVATVDFGSEGRPMPFGTEASVDLSTAAGTCSDELRCPGLRIDAGGGVRLCGNRLASGC